MGKLYFRDVSRRLLLFALLLLGAVTQAKAVDRYVIVFRDLPYTDNGQTTEVIYGTTPATLKSKFFKVYQGSDDFGAFAKYVDGAGSALNTGAGKTFAEAKNTLGLGDPIMSNDFTLENPTGNIENVVADVKIRATSAGDFSGIAKPKRYYLHLGADEKVKSFQDFYTGGFDYTRTVSIGSISSVTKKIDLPLYTFTVRDANATVATLKNDILSKLKTAIGGVSGMIASAVTLHSSTGTVSSSTLVSGTYTYKFKLATPAGVKASFIRTDGATAPTSVEPNQSGAIVTVEGSIVVTDKTVVTLKVPAKETLSVYANETYANVSQLGEWIASVINGSIDSQYGSNITASNVKITRSGIVQEGDLAAADYSYSFDVTVNSEDYIVNIERSNSESVGSTITPSRIEGRIQGQAVKVSNSIEIKPVLEGLVYNVATFTPVSNQVQSEDALKLAILTGLSSKNKSLADYIYFENIQITDVAESDYPLAVNTYSYTFDVRARKDLKIAFKDAASTAAVTLQGDETANFTANGSITVKKATASKGSITFPDKFAALTYGTAPWGALRNVITMTNMPDEAVGYSLSLIAADNTEIQLDDAMTPPVGMYTVQLTLPTSDTYDYSSVSVSGGTKDAAGVVFKSTAKLTIGQQKIGAVELPIWLQTTSLGELGVTTAQKAKNLVLSQIPAIKGFSDVKIYTNDSFNSEVTKGNLTPGTVYSYAVILDPNYTDGGKTTTQVGAQIVSFDKATNSYKIKNAIAVKKESVTIALPDRITNPIKIGSFATEQDLIASLTASINTINAALFESTGLTATVSNVSLSTTDNAKSGYKVTVSAPADAAYKSKYIFSFVTDGSVSSANLKVTENVCTFENSLLFVKILPTTATTLRISKYSETFVAGWTAKNLTELISCDLLLKNAGVLVVEKVNNKFVPNYSVALLDAQGNPVNASASVSEGATYGYKVAINKNATLQEIDLDLPNVTVDNSVADKIVITYVNSVELKSRSEVNFISKGSKVTMTGVDFEYDFVAGITKQEIIERIKSAILYANPALIGYIGEVTLPNISNDKYITDKNGDFKSAYKVVFTDAANDFKAITVNGSTTGVTTEGTSYVYTGQFGLVARPVLTIKLNKYTFNKNDGSLTDDVIEQWIMADLLLINKDLMGGTITSVVYVPRTHSYTVRFQSSSKVRDVKFEPTVISLGYNGNYSATYLGSITFGEGGDIPGVPYSMSVNLPAYISSPLTFGKTAEEYGKGILADIQKLIKSDKEALYPQIPTLANWGGKISLINNESGQTAEAIADQSYPQVSNVYGYKLEFSNKADFEKFYTFAYTASGGNLEVDKNQFVYKLSVEIKKAAHKVTLPQVAVTYRDINTMAALQDSIKNAILEDLANATFFADVAKLIKPAKSFTVTLAAPAEGAVPAKSGYSYTVEFVKVVNDNITITTSGAQMLNVNKAVLELTFPVTSYKYGETKVGIESDLLNKFIDGNNDLFSQYACLANNLSDMFTMSLDDVKETPPAVGDYAYTITVKEGQRTAWDNFAFSFNGSAVFSGYQHQHGKGVSIGLRKLTVTLPTYLAATAEEGTAAKAVFVYGKTHDEIKELITADILALNPKLLKDELKYVALADDKGGAVAKTTPISALYDYMVGLDSKRYTIECVYADQTATVAESIFTVKSGLKITEFAVNVTIPEEINKIEGKWMIEKGAPVYSLPESWTDVTYGYELLSIADELKKTLTKEQWDNYFWSDYLNWALVNGKNEIVVQGKSLQDVLKTYVEKNITSGTLSLQIVKGKTEVPRLKSVVGDFDLNLGVTLATLKVTPAIVKVNPEKASYAKTYGVEVKNASDLLSLSDPSKPLAFTTNPKLTGAKLVKDFNLINLFVTIEPVDANVYLPYSPVGTYQIQATAAADVVANAFTPVVGVVFEPSDVKAEVLINRAPLAEMVQVKVGVSRVYGDDPVDSDVNVVASGDVDSQFVQEINAILNAVEGRVNWIDWASFNKKTNAGKYEVRFTSAAKANMIGLLTNFDMSGVAITLDSLVVKKAPLRVVADDKSRVYGVANPELTITYEGLKNNEENNLKDVFNTELPQIATDATVSARGSWDIYFVNTPKAKNYDIDYVLGTLSIDKVKRVIVWSEDQRNLTIAVGETVELSAAVTSADDNKLSITGLRYVLSNNDRERVELYQNENGKMMIEGKIRTLDGDVTITVYADGDATTYEAADPVSGTIKVVEPEGEAANVNIIVSNVTSVYDGTPRAVTVKAADKEGKVIDYKVFYEGDQTASTVYPSDQNAPVDAGTYTVTVKAEVGASTFSYEAKNKMIIAPRVVEVKARSFATTYGKAVPDFKNAYDYNKSDFLAGEDFDADKAPVVRAEGYKGNAGTYRLTPHSVQDFGSNYKVNYVSGELLVNKAPLTISADDQESVYGQDLKELTYAFDGFVNNETIKHLGFVPRISSTVTKGADAGTYPIVFADNYKSVNYEVTYKDGKYVVVPAAQKISWNPKTTLKMEQKDLLLTATASSKLPVSYISSNDNVAYVNQIGDNWILTPVSDGLVKVTAIQNGNKNYWGAESLDVVFAIGNAYESVGNESIEFSDQIEVYPTIFSTSITVAAPSAIKRVELISYTGVLLKVFNQPESVIDLSNFGEGFYLLNVVLEDGTSKSVKLIKKK